MKEKDRDEVDVEIPDPEAQAPLNRADRGDWKRLRRLFREFRPIHIDPKRKVQVRTLRATKCRNWTIVKRKVKYAKAVEKRRRWLKRRKKRRRKLIKMLKKLKKQGKLDEKSPLKGIQKTPEQLKRALKRRKLLKMFRKKQKKMRNQRRRRKLGICGKIGRKTEFKKMVKTMKKAQKKEMIRKIKQKLRERKQKRKIQRKRHCKQKRIAIKELRKAAKKARHRRKKLLRVRRREIAEAKQEGTYVPKNNKPKQKNYRDRVMWTRPKMTVTREEIYVDEFPEEPEVLVEDKKDTVVYLNHDKPITFNNTLLKIYEPVRGRKGKSIAKTYHVPPLHCHFRWNVTGEKKECSMKELDILTLLAAEGSSKSLRVYFSGHYKNLDYCMTSLYGENLGDLMKEYNNDFPNSVVLHIMEQTLRCIQALHKVGYTHLQIRPTSFAILKHDPRSFLLIDFDKAEFFQGKDDTDDNEGDDSSDENDVVEKNPPDPYMARRQHFGQTHGVADDYESWFYICAQMLSKERLKWEDEKDHFKMAISKYEFPKYYGHPNSYYQTMMAEILARVLAASNENFLVAGNQIQKLIARMKGDLRKDEVEKYMPWERLDKFGREKERMLERMKKEKEKLEGIMKILDEEVTLWTKEGENEKVIKKGKKK